jgi:Flp pilus assembly protein protease CpaA
MFKLLLTFSFLLVSSYLDLKTRNVSNKITFTWLLIALVIAGYDISQRGSSYLLIVGLSWVAMSILTYLLFAAKILGGADVKALISLSLLYPQDVFLILGLAFLLTICVKKFKDISNFPFMLPLTGGFILTVL